MLSFFSTGLALVAVVYVAAFARTWRRLHELRVVRCPGTGGGAALHLGGAGTAIGLGVGAWPHVTRCSLWPERRLCAQSCLAEVETSPEQCAFEGILARWYCGRSCACCRRLVAPVRWGEPRPSLLSPGGRLVTWLDIDPPSVYEVLSMHRAVCAGCTVAERFRRDHPDLIVEGPRDVAANGR
jgi:hypothetical protein